MRGVWLGFLILLGAGFWELASSVQAATPASAALKSKHHIILCGGPALRKWEDLRVEKDQHDRWWANFIRASTIRMDEIKRAYGESAAITWIVYRPGYVARGIEDGAPYTSWISGQAAKRGVKLVWVKSGLAAINAINRHPPKSVVSFDFFGHSNKHCFLLDYSVIIMAASKAWIHEKDLSRIRSDIFARNAQCQSWGCHTGESMSSYWKQAVGQPMIGARGKTDYVTVGQGQMPAINGRWVR